VQEVANEVGISKMCHKILIENLGMQPVAAKSAPHLLNDEQTQRCLEVSQGLFDHANNDKNFLKTSLQVMTHGFSVMVSKQKPILHNGSKNDTQTQISMASSVKCESDVDCFFVLKVLFTMNFYLMARLSTKSTILK